MFIIKNFVGAGVFLVVGIAFILIGRLILNNPAIPKEYAGEVKGVITQIDQITTTDSKGKKAVTHRVMVAFAVDGRQYGGLLGEYNITMKQGKEIDLIYDVRNPNTYATPYGNKVMAYILMGMGGVAVLTSPAMLLGFGRSRRLGL